MKNISKKQAGICFKSTINYRSLRAVLLYLINKNSTDLRIKHFITNSNVDYKVLFYYQFERW